jgi:hypothetical protein
MGPIACATGLRMWFPSRRFRRVAAARGRVAGGATGVAQVARKQHTGPMALFLELQENTGRAQDVASVDEGSVHADGDL